MNKKDKLIEKNFFWEEILENSQVVLGNSKKTKKIILKFFQTGGIFMLVFIWIFSGWLPLWKNPQIPPKIETVHAATQTYATGSGNWTAPITGTITVQCWGGGGSGGGGRNSRGAGGGGGAGGQYATKDVSVTKGTSYAYSVGSGGAGVTRGNNGNSGGDTTFGSSNVVAKGGAGGTSYDNGGAGGTGTTSGGVGDTVYAGGSGASSGSGYSGGGGGGAGSSGAGNNASTTTGGSAKTENGGAGGNGFSGNNGNGYAGSVYGGAGGGAVRNGTSGAGAGGYIVINYPDNTAPTVALNTADGNNFGFDTTPMLDFTGSDANYLDDIRYNIQVCSSSDNTCNSPFLDKVSGTDTGFSGSPDNTDPFNSGQLVSYTIQSAEALSGGTYYWRVRGIDPNGTNVYGNWSVIRSFEISSPTISVSVSDGFVTYGEIALNSEKDTTSSGLNDTQTATNDGNVTADLNIKTSHAVGGTQWSAGAVAGANTYVHSFSTNGGSSWEILQTVDTYETLATAISASGTEEFDLKIGTPTSTADYQQKTITVTIQAVQN